MVIIWELHQTLLKINWRWLDVIACSQKPLLLMLMMVLLIMKARVLLLHEVTWSICSNEIRGRSWGAPSTSSAASKSKNVTGLMIKILWVPNVGQTKDHARSVVVGVVGVLSVGKVVTWQRSQRSWVSRTLLSQRVTEGSMCNETVSPAPHQKQKEE